MSMTSARPDSAAPLWGFAHAGMLWFLIAVAGAAFFFRDGLDALLVAWSQPEYSHGPLIPLLSALLFLRQLKEVPVNQELPRSRWVGVAVIGLSLALAALGKLSNVSDIVAYGIIVWVYGILLVSFGWRTGWLFWPPVLHLVYMLPLPVTIYYKFSAWLQLISSELGVWFLRLLSVPVFLEGNIIDLGVYKLHVAEACSGLRYLFPILSFSYIFAVLYKGPMWHKAVLLISAAPITVLMNSVRIAVAGYIVNHYGIEWVEGFTHFFEGWVIFLMCIVMLFGLARLMLFLQPEKMSLAQALDLETEGLATQAARLRYIEASPAMVVTAVLTLVLSLGFAALPDRTGTAAIQRESFVAFPREIGEWRQEGAPEILDPEIAKVLAADDYHSVQLSHPSMAAPVGLFMAWYSDQLQRGVHSPEICLPGGGWEIAWLERSDITERLGADRPFNLNRAIIQKGETRMMVYYWFQVRDRRIAWDIAAKFWLTADSIPTGRTDGALVRLTTPILRGESEAEAEARLFEVLQGLEAPLPRFIPAS
jgi:exosortase D (VPLPA-CTERM-specific)